HTNELSYAFVAAAQEAGIPFSADFNGGHQNGAGLYQLTTRMARRWSAVDAFIRPLVDDARLEVLTDVEVEGVVFDGDKARGVRYVRDGATVEQRCDAEVILSAGAIATPKLLMLSGLGAADELSGLGIKSLVDLPGVGANFMDHCEVPVAAYTREPLGYYGVDKGVKSWLAGLQYLLCKTGPVASNGVEAGGFFHTDDDSLDPNIQIFAVPGIYLDKDVTDVRPGHGITLNACLVQPNSRGTVRLRSVNPKDHPKIVTGFLSDEGDMETMIKGVRKMRDIFACDPLRSLVREEVLPGPSAVGREQLVSHIKRFVKTVYHPMGTARMGKSDDPMAVVDPSLKVRGVTGLRVVDASVMPTPVSGNTVASVYMLAETAAKFIG
ncbi:MAG: GMC family oxidoreductase, partial [Phyllobacterium sp.]